MDELDCKILGLLSLDARTPFKIVAAKLGVATETVVRRYKKLQEQGVILGSTVLLSSKACGFRELVGYFVKTKAGSSISAVKEKLVSVPKVNLVTQEWGYYDFYVETFLADLSEMHEILSYIRRIEGIVSVAPMIYSQRDWSIPFLLPFPDICPWLNPATSGKP